MNAILNELIEPTSGGAIRQHDLLAFQEMFSIDTFSKFKFGLQELYPYSHYYLRGRIGSGLAIFSKHPIVRVGFHSYSLNGRPTKIFDGDWFAEKGVAHARIQHPKGTIDIFTTHLVADYSGQRADDYLVHRAIQTYELMRFIESQVDHHAVGTILMGDLNIEMTSLPWRAFIWGEGMKSVFEGLPRSEVPCTCNCELNGYKSPGESPKTIDHILFKGNLRVVKGGLAFTGEVPPKRVMRDGVEEPPRAYSDHYALSYELAFGTDWHKKREKIDEKAVHTAVELIRSERVNVSGMLTWSGVSSIVMLFIVILLTGTAVFVMANASTQPTWILLCSLALLPLLVSSALLNGANWFLYLPRETALLGHFAEEISYWLAYNSQSK
jgi:endonuclease/exonuclease/phosphatase family metal-dependent hydrolase